MYTDLPPLANFLLEESYVLDLVAQPGVISIRSDLVLTPEHPEYAMPSPGEQMCFRLGTITITGVRDLTWTGQGLPPAVDANDERDYGNIDSFEWESGRFVLEGSFGVLDVHADDVEVSLE